MQSTGPHQRSNSRKSPALAAALVFLALIVAAVLWTSHEKEAARNDPRTGTTSEISPKTPTPAPGGGAHKDGG
jgi:hypothetical protein